MFEIRIICDPADTDTITTSLAEAFATGPVRQYPTRDAQRARLYLTADHRTGKDSTPDPTVWPSPAEAYALAPSIAAEMGWAAEQELGRPTYALLGREFWLRKAAVLDRIALADETHHAPGDAGEAAVEAAHRLMNLDAADTGSDPRGYVRQQYAHWATQQ
ncbi:hypothetical protein [Streptomyces sp. PR69]|uniref:hypothetical protein n=1 Tax=Streptomyces sp. PR69 TaxID=2984950 RepID=UPI0022643DD9|nr:hypothetical protein [Streptomyces sp. PR69]